MRKGRTKDSVSNLYKKHRHVIHIAAICIVLICISLYVWETVIPKYKDQAGFVSTGGIRIETDVQKIGQKIEEKFMNQSIISSGLRFEFDSVKKENKGTIRIDIKDQQDGRQVFSDIIDMDHLNQNPILDCNFIMEEKTLDNTYKIEIEVLESQPENDLKIVQMQQESGETTSVIGVIGIDYSFLPSYLMFLILSISIFVILMYCLIFIIGMKAHTNFLVASLILGFIISFMITPLSKPDERTHVYTAYRNAGLVLGYEEPDEDIQKLRVEDRDTYFSMHANVSSWKSVHDHMFDKAKDTSVVEVHSNWISANSILYLPATLGVLIARVLGLNNTWLLMLGSWFNLISYSFMGWWAIKKTPIGKSLLFVIALLPMSIQQGSSFSYDAIINGFAFLFSAYFLSAMYEDRKMKKSEIFILTLLSYAILISKNIVYMPIVLCLLLLPFRKSKDRSKKDMLKISIGIVGVALVLFGITTLSGLLRRVGGASETTDGVKILEWCQMQGYTLTDILQNKKHVIKIFIDTFLYRSEFYIKSFIGESLSYFSIHVSSMLTYLFLILLGISTIREEKEEQLISNPQKLYIFTMSFGSILLIMASMLYFWTPLSYTTIEGVQGRYYIPIAFLLLLLCRNSTVVSKKSMVRPIMFAMCFLQMIYMMCLITSIV